ncbi:MAG: ATP-binding protein [bacterium]|nr:ATP-binding protein [bacterium]
MLKCKNISSRVFIFFMTFYALSALINTIASIFLGFFTYFQDTRKLVHKIFALFCLAMAVWSYAYFMWQTSATAQAALFWSHALMAGAIFIPLFYLHFLLALLNKIKEKKKILIFGYISLSLFFLLNFSPWFIDGVKPKLNFTFWPNAGILFHPFLIVWFFYVIYAVYLLIREYGMAVGVQKKQIQYILIGTIIGYLGGATNYPLWYNVPIPPIGNWTTTIYIATVAYAITRYRFMDIKVILTEFLVFVIGLVLLVEAIIPENLAEFLFRGGLFIFFCIIGYLLIKSVMLEISRRTELQRLYHEVDKLSKAKSEFISIASHQLRTPLTAIKGYVSMMIEGVYGKLSEKQKDPLKNVYQSSERLIKLVNDLLNLSRLEAGKIEFKPEPVLLEDVVSSIVEELKINAEKKGLYLKIIKPAAPLPKITADQDKLRHVILNIIDNAIKYTQAGGITIALKQLDFQTRIEISDTGEGMTKKEIEGLFQTFARAKAGTKLNSEGVGIGLYVAKKFVEMHKGKIWAESKGEGKGSTFYIELPIS